MHLELHINKNISSVLGTYFYFSSVFSEFFQCIVVFFFPVFVIACLVCLLLFSIVLHREGHGLAKSPSVKYRFGEGSCYMFEMEQVLILSRYLSMIVCVAWLKIAGETGKHRAPASVKERPLASSFPMA